MPTSDHPLPTDPKALLEVLARMSGLEFLQAIKDGKIPMPPMGQLLGFKPHYVEKGVAVFTAIPGKDHYNPLGGVHGGYTSTLLDTCMACAVHSTLRAGQRYTTLELKVNFLRGISEQTGELRAEGRVIHPGRQTAVAEGRILDQRGRILAHATTTCLIMSGDRENS